MELDLKYLCTTIGNLAYMPIRIYEKGRQTFYYSLIQLPVDPITPYLHEIFRITETIGYYVTDQFYYYAVVNHGSVSIVVGPTRHVPATQQELRHLGFLLNVDEDDLSSFVQGMQHIMAMPLESVMQMMCTINYVLNGEKKTLRDITIVEEQQESISFTTRAEQMSKIINEPAMQPHNTYDLELHMLAMVEKGDTAALQEWMNHAPSVRGGVIAADPLRQMKNTFIVSITNVSRAAIRGGMMEEDAFSLSDSYIQKCELMKDTNRISNLMVHMVMEFTERVEKLRFGKAHGKLTVSVINYIQHHLSEPANVEKMAKELYMSRSFLSRKFKSETGINLIDFILMRKSEEGKRLLRYTDRTITDISGYLGFSSPAHFSRTFRKYIGKTPGEYRAKYRKEI